MLKSTEPDNKYYIQNYALVADHEINLDVEPPPDLVVEMDITDTVLWRSLRFTHTMGVTFPEYLRLLITQHS